MLVPRRFGVGITANLGNVRTWALLAILAAGVAAVIVATRRG